MANNYDIPNWAGKPPTGLHLDVLKEDKLVQKLMVDEKRCYLFGRINQLNDICIDHASCSRVHAALVYHKHLNLAYLVDLGSTHGTFIGTLRLESHKPTKLQINSTFHFGASTRRYVLRQRPCAGQRNSIKEDLPVSESCDGTLLGLPQNQTELDNLTEYNTAHNRRISMLGITEDNLRKQILLKQDSRKRKNVTFNEEEIIINPEDVDPNVGRFRNLVQTTIVPPKQAGFEHHQMDISSNSNSSATNCNIQQQTVTSGVKHQLSNIVPTLPNPFYQGPTAFNEQNISSKINSTNDFDVTPIAMGTKLGLMLPNPAPDVTPTLNDINISTSIVQKSTFLNPNLTLKEHHSARKSCVYGPQKKKYAKEAWPGRKPMLGQL